MEKNKNLGLELFSNILDVLEDGGYDMEGSLHSWMDDSIFEMFDATVEEEKDSIVDENTKKKIMETLIEMCPGFFNDKSNVIYLKLLNLYEMFLSKGEENQELYYVVDRFAPAQGELNKVNQTLTTIEERVLGSETFKKVFNSIYADAMNEYWLADEYGRKQVEENQDDDLIKEASETLKNSVGLYTDEYVFKMVSDNRADQFVEMITSLKSMSLPMLFCVVYGSKFTHDEKMLMASELDEVQQELLSSTIEGRTK